MVKKPLSVNTRFRMCTIEAPCKINLHLSIGKKKPDGFHNLSSLFSTLAFSDTIKFECSGEDGENIFSIKQEIPHSEIPDKNNLILRAISLFRQQTDYKAGLKIHLIKRIPIGAGLGGGSSDAASTLLALNQLAGTSSIGLLSMEKLMEMAAFLGSDVPFFINFFFNSIEKGGAAYVSGRGELVEPLKSPQGLWVVLVMPPFPSNTALAFDRLDQMRERASAYEREEEIEREPLSKETLIRSLAEGCETWPFYNDFLTVFLSKNDSKEDVEKQNKDEGDSNGKSAIYSSIFKSLMAFGASFVGLSGAGSCCFGLFYKKKMAEKAEKGLSIEGNFVRVTFFLAHRADPVLK